ncbi:MAG: hypothetical protein KDN20_00475 [Verrucomicrobiae bacterium]|nr:hypothetical protein [Verrucomicrobiae bacterium]
MIIAARVPAICLFGILALICLPVRAIAQEKLAIAADERSLDLAALTTAAFTASGKIEALERIDWKELVQERSLQSEEIALRLKSATAVLLLETVTLEERPMIVARLISSRTGTTSWGGAYGSQDLNAATSGIVDSVVAEISANQDLSAGERRMVVSVQSFGPKIDPANREASAKPSPALTRLLIADLANQPDVEVAERLELERPALEQWLAQNRDSKLAGATLFADADFESEDGRTILTVAISRSVGLPFARRQLTLGSTDPMSIVQATAAAIVDLAKREANPVVSVNSPPPVGGMDDGGEGGKIYEEAARLYRSGLFREAELRATSAVELGYGNHPGLAMTRIYSVLLKDIPKATPITIGDRSTPHFVLPRLVFGFGFGGVGELSPAQRTGLSEAMKLAKDYYSRLLPAYFDSRDQGDQTSAGKGDVPDYVSLNIPALDSIERFTQQLDAYVAEIAWRVHPVIRGQTPTEPVAAAIQDLIVEWNDFHAARTEFSPYARQTWPNPLTECLADRASGETVLRLRNRFDLEPLGKPPVLRFLMNDGARETAFLEERGKLFGRFASDKLRWNTRLTAGSDIDWRGLQLFYTSEGAVPAIDLIRRALAGDAGLPRGAISLMDEQLLDLSLASHGPDMEAALARFRSRLIELSKPLGEARRLDTYGALLANIDQRLEIPGAIGSSDPVALEWWKTFFGVLNKNQTNCSPFFGQRLVNALRSYKLAESDPVFFAALTEHSIRNVPVQRSRPAPIPIRRSSPPPQLPVVKTSPLDIFHHYLIEKNRLLVGTTIDDGKLYLLLLSTEHRESGIDMRDANLAAAGDFIPLPEELWKHLAAPLLGSKLGVTFSRLNADIKVTADTIQVAGSGATGVLDRQTGHWSVTPHSLLIHKDAYAIVGGRVATIAGAASKRYPSDSSAPVDSSHGLFGLDVEGQITTFFDTARRPVRSEYDALEAIEFYGEPAPLTENTFLVAFRSPKTLLQQFVRCGWAPDAAEVVADIRGEAGINWDERFTSGGWTQNASESRIIRTSEGRMEEGLSSLPGSIVAFAFDRRDGHYLHLIDTRPPAPTGKFLPEGSSVSLYSDKRPLYSWSRAGTPIPLSSTKMRLLPWTDGERLLLLSLDKTSDGRRVMYFWPSRLSPEPVPVAIHLKLDREAIGQGVPNAILNLFGIRANDEISRMFFLDGHLILVTPVGIWSLPKDEWLAWLEKNR